jgi:hypothetical protein
MMILLQASAIWGDERESIDRSARQLYQVAEDAKRHHFQLLAP